MSNSQSPKDTSSPLSSPQTNSSNKEGGNNSADNNEDKYKKFEGEGVVFKAKLVGTELVMEPRGDKMCQNSIQRLKAIIKGQKSHKKRIVLKISYSGVKIYDEKTNEILHHHEVSQISFIASDDTDNRTFGYVCDVPNKAHQFICFKTSGPAMQVMSVMSSLFEAVFAKKKEGKKESSGQESDKTEESKDKSNDMKLIKEDSLTGHLDDFEGGKTNKSSSPFGASKTSNSIDLVGDQFSDLVLGHNGSLNSNIASNMPTSGANNSSNSNNVSSLARALSNSSGMKHYDSFEQFNWEQPEQPAATTNVLTSNTSTTMLTKQRSLNDTSPVDLIGGDSGIMDSPSTFSEWLPSPPIPPQPHMSIAGTQQRQPVTMSAVHKPIMATTQNRSLIYNHSSVSLNDAALTRQSSFTTNSSGHNDSTDKYAVFNDIDNLPSIFESTSSLGSTSKLSNVAPTNGNSGFNIMNTMSLTSSASFQDSKFAFPISSSTNSNAFSPNYSSGGGDGRPGPTPNMMVPVNPSNPSAFGSNANSGGMIVGSAPMSIQMSQHARLSSSMVASLHQRLGSSAASVQSVGSAGGLSRQTNPFDDDFFA